MLIKNATYYDGRGIRKGDFTNGQSDDEFDASGKFAFPAFNNAHTHLAMTLMRGAGEDQKLDDWLNKTIFPMESRLTSDLVYWGSMLGLLEMIKTGTSHFNDMYYFVEDTARAVERSGIEAELRPISGQMSNEVVFKAVIRYLAGPDVGTRRLSGERLHAGVIRARTRRARAHRNRAPRRARRSGRSRRSPLGAPWL